MVLEPVSMVWEPVSMVQEPVSMEPYDFSVRPSPLGFGFWTKGFWTGLDNISYKFKILANKLG